MADSKLELLLRIIAQVDGLRDVEGLRESVEQLDPALSNLAERAKAALNPMNGLADSAHNFGEAVKETTQPLSDLATTALKVTSVAAALATALGGAVYQEAKKFESAQLDLKKVLGGTQEELDIYGQKLNALALEFGVSSNALTASMAAFVQAGFSADEALNLVTQSLKLKVAGDVEAGQSSEYLIKMLKGFGAQAADSARFVDVLNEVSNCYATDVQQLAEAMSRVAPISKQMGLSFEETAGVLTPMIESFGSGADAAEAFKTGVLKLIDNAAPVRDALLSIGVAQTDLNGNLRSGKDILNDVMVAFQTTGQEQKLFLTSQLVGIDQAPRMIEAFDSLNKVLLIQKTGLEAAGSAQAEVNIRLQSAETIANRSAESFRQLAVALGTNYREEVKGVVDATGALARGFLEAEKAGSMDGLFAAVKPQLEAVETLFRQMAANLPAAFAQLDFSPLTSAITDLGGEVSDAFQAFMGSIDLSTVDGLRQLLQYLADSMAALIRFTAGAVDQMEPFFKAMGTAARFAAENADSISRLAGEVAGFSLTVNKLLPLLADFAANTFSIIGTVAEAAFEVGLLVGAIKLLNLAGISVLPMLGNLALAIGGLNLSTATIAAAFAGAPGVILALGAAAGTAGYAVGTVLSAGIDAAAEAITGTSLGGLIYDLAEALGLENTEADQAKITQDQLAAARERHADAAKKQAEAQREQELAAARAAKAQEEQIALAGATDKANRLLTAGFQESGLVWNAATGELVRVSDAMSGIAPASLTVKNALRELGVDYAAFSGGISAGSEKLVFSFKKITEDVTANAPIVAAALRAAVSKAETTGDLEAIEAAFKKFVETGKASASEVAAAQSILSKKFIELAQAQDPAIQNMAAMAKESSGYVRAVENVVDAESESIKASIALAKAKGDTAEVQRLTIKLTEQEADGAVRIAKAKQAEQEMEYALAVAVRNKVQSLVEKNQATSEDLALAELTAQKELAEAQAAGVNTEAQIQLAAALRQVNAAKSGASSANTEHAASTEKSTEATNKNAAANRNSTDILKGLVDKVNNARKEMAGLSENTQLYFDVMLANELKMRGFAGAFDATRVAQNRLNAAIGESNPELAKLESGLATAKEAVARLEKELINSPNSFRTFELAVEKAKGLAIAAFNEQAIEATKLTQRFEAFAESGSSAVGGVAVTMHELRNATMQAQNDMGLLDQQRLDALRGSIEAANQKLVEMQQEAQSAQDRIAELNAEIAAEKGDTATADRLKLELDQQQQIAEVEAQLAQARAQNNRELITLYEEQKQKLQELYSLKERNLEADIKAREQEARAAKTQTQTTTTSSGGSGSGSGSAGGKTYNLNLNAGGKTLNTVTNTDPGAWLDDLERARRGAA